MTDRQIVDKVKDALHGDDNNDVRIASGHDVSTPELIERTNTLRPTSQATATLANHSPKAVQELRGPAQTPTVLSAQDLPQEE
jgi:hypothetical protein